MRVIVIPTAIWDRMKMKTNARDEKGQLELGLGISLTNASD